MTATVLDVAAPVLRQGGRGVVAAATRRALHLDLDGWVVTVTGPEAPALPNGVRLGAPLPAVAPGTPAELGPGVLRAGPLLAAWAAADPPAWNPVLARRATGSAPRARGRAILAALDGRAPPLTTRLPGALARPGALVGLGPGLTQEGDDLLAGAAAALAARGAPMRLPDDLRARTTALSATLLELAVTGAAPRPAHRVADPGCVAWRAALEELCGLGASTGRAWAAGLAHGLLAPADPVVAQHGT